MIKVIAPFYLHKSLKNYYMKKNNQNFLIGYTFIDPHNFINSFIKQIKEPNYIELNNSLKSLNLSFFKDYINSYKFIDYYFNKLKNLIIYNVSLDTLDTSTIYYQEIKRILLEFNKYDLYEKHYHDVLKIINNMDFSNYIIYDTKSDIFLNNIYQILLKNNATLFNDVICNNELFLHKSLNSRTEIESIAQLIIDRDINASAINIVCPNSYHSLLKQVFNRYNIPIEFYNYRIKSDIAKNFVLLVRYFQVNNNNNLYNAILHNSFNINESNKFIIKYLNLLPNDIDIYKEFNYYKNLKDNDLDLLIKLRKIENKAESYRKEIINILDCINVDNHNIETLLQSIINYFCTVYNKNIINKIVSVIEKNSPFSDEQLNIILEIIYDMNISYKNKYTNSVTITDINHPILNNDYCFILGLNQNNYPGFSSETGYINENYLINTNYPKEKVRYANHMNKLNWLFNNANYIYMSYSMIDFDGSIEELSFYIESMMTGTINFYPLKQNDITLRKNNFKLSQECTNEACLNNNQINTTVYKLENFFSCQTSYLLKDILNLKKEDLYNFNKFLGNLNHQICEEYVNNNFTITNDYIKQLNDELFNKLKLLHPCLKNKLNILQLRNFNNILININELKNIDKRSNYKPFKLEHNIRRIYKTNIVDIVVNGRVDRIDKYNNKISIIDYKSSDHSINQNSVNSCMHLQLPIYLDAYTFNNNLIPNSCMYFSFDFENTYLNDYTLEKGLVHETNNDLHKNDINKKLQGLIFDNHKDIDINSKNFSKIFTFNKEGINNMLEEFSSTVLKGIFISNPKEKSCDFCPYIRICNFNGSKSNFNSKFEIITENKGDNGDNHDNK